MFSRQLRRCSHCVVSAIVLTFCVNVVAADSAPAQTTSDTGATRVRGGRGSGQGPRMSGSPNGFDGATPQMFEQFFEKIMRERIQMNDDQIARWRAWNKRFDPERGGLLREERETRKMLQLQLSPAATPDDAKATDILDRLGQLERKWVALHERENKELGTFMKPSQRLRFFALQDRVKRDMQEAQSRREGGRDGGRGGMRGDSTGGKFQRGGSPMRPPGRADTLSLGQKPKDH